MTYKIDSAGRTDNLTTLAFEGVLDRAALADLASRCEARLRQGAVVRVWLRAGTQVETGILDELLQIKGISVVAEAPFLARWIASCGKRSGTEVP